VVGVPAPASTPEFLVKVLGEKYKLDLVAAPYRGSAPMIGDMLGNQIAAGVGSVPDFIENHKSGRVQSSRCSAPGASRAARRADPGRAGRGRLRGPAVLRLLRAGGTPKAEIERFSSALARVLAIPRCTSGSSRSAWRWSS
jgi:tripartite-type tricarboxylate transporter receptor subunit TctC